MMHRSNNNNNGIIIITTMTFPMIILIIMISIQLAFYSNNSNNVGTSVTCHAFDIPGGSLFSRTPVTTTATTKHMIAIPPPTPRIIPSTSSSSSISSSSSSSTSTGSAVPVAPWCEPATQFSLSRPPLPSSSSSSSPSQPQTLLGSVPSVTSTVPSTTDPPASSTTTTKSPHHHHHPSPPITTSTTSTTTITESSTKKSSLPQSIVSLVKSIVGGGVLAIPAAVTALGDAPVQILPWAVVLIAAMGGINAYYFRLLGLICDWTRATTFAQAWERTMGPDTSTLFAVMIAIKTALSCVAYAMIIAESFQAMAVSAGWLYVTPTEALLTVTGVALLPLCLMKDLSSLAPFSLAGIIGFVYTAGVMTLRALDGTYHLAPIDAVETGKFFLDLPDPYKPRFGHTGPEWQGLVLACTLATAFVSHYNAPRFHNELETKEDFETVTYTSFAISAALMAVIAVAGFSTFGTASAPVILNNYSPFDSLIVAGRTAIAASLVATFPFPFFGLRDSMLDAMNVPIEERDNPESSTNNVILTVALLTMITGIALSVNDLSLLMSVGGGTIATAVYSVFPTVMFHAAVKNQHQLLLSSSSSSSDEKEAKSFTDQHQSDIYLSTGLMGLCVLTGATGVGLALQHHFVH